jgi:predicted XRE-type DNA-binding protein
LGFQQFVAEKKALRLALARRDAKEVGCLATESGSIGFPLPPSRFFLFFIFAAGRLHYERDNHVRDIVQAQNNTNEKFASALKKLMAQNDLNQATLADSLGVAQSAVSNYLKGRVPKTEILRRLSVYFQVSVESMLEGSPTLSIDPTAEYHRCIELRHLMEVAGWGVEETAQNLNVTRADISEAYAGVRIPTTDLLKKFRSRVAAIESAQPKTRSALGKFVQTETQVTGNKATADSLRHRAKKIRDNVRKSEVLMRVIQSHVKRISDIADWQEQLAAGIEKSNFGKR